MRVSLEGASALVTGGTSGIGAEVVRQLGAVGAQVAVVGRDRERLTAMCAPNRRLHAVEADLAEEDACAAVAARTNKLFERLDVVVHAAGIFLPGAFGDTSLENLQRSLAVNLVAPFRLTQAVLPQLRAGSSIVFVSSVAGHVGLTGEAAYSASKAGVEGLTRALAMELAPKGIRVNAVAPGFTETPMNADFRSKDASIAAGAVQATLANRLGRPEDIATAIVFLASPAASFIWGAVMPVDGGYPTSHVQLKREW